ARAPPPAKPPARPPPKRCPAASAVISMRPASIPAPARIRGVIFMAYSSFRSDARERLLAGDALDLHGREIGKDLAVHRPLHRSPGEPVGAGARQEVLRRRVGTVG